GPGTRSIPNLVQIGGVGTCSPTRLLLIAAGHGRRPAPLDSGHSRSVPKVCQTRMPAVFSYKRRRTFVLPPTVHGPRGKSPRTGRPGRLAQIAGHIPCSDAARSTR